MEDNKLEEIQEDRKEKLALALLADSDGGKQILKALRADIATATQQLATSYLTATHTELITLCARLGERLALYQALTKAEDNVQELDNIIKEILTEQ